MNFAKELSNPMNLFLQKKNRRKIIIFPLYVALLMIPISYLINEILHIKLCTDHLTEIKKLK